MYLEVSYAHLCLSLTLKHISFFLDIYLNNECEAFKHYPDCSATLHPSPGEKNIIRVEQYHLALQHYRGGHPVPRVASSYDGGLLIYANILANVGFFSLLFAYFNSIQTAKSQDLIAIDIQMGSC